MTINFLLGVCVLIIVIFIIELLRPQGYSITTEGIIIQRKIKNIKIMMDQIMDIKEINSSFFSIGFGFHPGPITSIMPYGLCWSPKYGLIHLNITKRKNKLLVILNNNKKYLISPDEDEKILINKYCYLTSHS